MLLDPFEEQLDLPTTPIKLGDCQRGQGKVVGQKNQRLARFRILEANATKRGFEVLFMLMISNLLVVIVKTLGHY